MKEPDYLDHNGTDEIVCPYCSYKFECSYEFNFDSGEVSCDDCGKDFLMERDTWVTYNTSKK